MVRLDGHSEYVRELIAAAKRCALISAAAVIVCLLLVPPEAAAWGARAHQKIAEDALSALPAEHSRNLLLYKDDLFRGISEGLQRSKDDATEATADIQLLTLLPHKGDDFSRYYAFRLGELSVVVSDMALPITGTGSSDKNLLKRLESDVDADVNSYRITNVNPMVQTYPAIYLDRVKAEARKSEEYVRTRYLAAGGYAACKEGLLQPAFKNAVQAVSNLWRTILSKEAEPGAISPSIRVIYYTSQIKFASERGYLDDVELALRKLTLENRRVPLTTAFVGEKFFKLPRDDKTKRIYELAKTIDPQSATIASCYRECGANHIEEPPKQNQELAKRRKVAQYLYGKDGKPPIYVYEHTSGKTLYSSEPQDVGSDYVCLNFEPIKKVSTKNVVRKVKNEPEVEEYDLEEIIRVYAKEYGVPVALVKAVIKAESNFDPFAVSGCGARGLMQLMPTTAMDMQITDCFDPEQNIGGGVQYLAKMLELFNDDRELALAAYNAGPGSVLKHGGIPPFRETREYVPRVLTYYEQYKRDIKPVTLKVAMNEKPAADYLPEIEIVVQVKEETLVYNPPVPKQPKDMVVVHLRNGNTMRGNSYEKISSGIRLFFDNGSFDIPEAHITKIT